MKHVALIMILFVALTSCSLFKTKIKLEDAIAEKVKVESTSNPAKKYLILNNLKKKRIVLNDVVVKQVTSSTNIDYDYCIITEVMAGDKKIECYVYTKNVYKISKLQEGVTRINVVGDFKRFFSMLDEFYTKLEIVEAKITLSETPSGEVPVDGVEKDSGEAKEKAAR
ncbi:MAG TPA: hypothetical protein PK859_05620 [Spirochaetota bacterium]|nr:hypothetical protein [Spirochaetota bacterium]HPR47159.1 hypothetical protein [Spirochaetota bacterium]